MIRASMQMFNKEYERIADFYNSKALLDWCDGRQHLHASLAPDTREIIQAVCREPVGTVFDHKHYRFEVMEDTQ